MNCALFLELNERLKTDVTIKCMRLNKGLAQRTCDFISIIFDIRPKNFVAISTVKDAKFQVCKHT